MGSWDFYCWDVQRVVPRAFTMSEINLINDALRSWTYQVLYDSIAKEEDQTYLGEELSNKSSNVDIFEKNRKQNDELINKVLDIHKNDKFIMQLPSNVHDLNKSIKTNEFPSISPLHLEQFFNNFFNNISKKSFDNQSNIVNLIVKSLGSHEEFKIDSVRLFITNNKSKLDLYYLFLNYNEKDELYTVSVKMIKTDIELRSSLLIVKINDHETINFSSDGGFDIDNTTNDLMPLMNLFEIVCQ